MDIVLDSPISDGHKKSLSKRSDYSRNQCGAAVMSKKMITGDEFKHPEYTGDFRTIEAENIEIERRTWAY